MLWSSVLCLRNDISRKRAVRFGFIIGRRSLSCFRDDINYKLVLFDSQQHNMKMLVAKMIFRD